MNQAHKTVAEQDEYVMSPALTNDRQDVVKGGEDPTTIVSSVQLDQKNTTKLSVVPFHTALLINTTSSPVNEGHGIIAHTDSLLKCSTTSNSMVSLSKQIGQVVYAKQTQLQPVTDLDNKSTSLLSQTNGRLPIKLVNGGTSLPISLLNNHRSEGMTPNFIEQSPSVAVTLQENMDARPGQADLSTNNLNAEKTTETKNTAQEREKMQVHYALPEIVKRQHSIDKRVTRLMKRLRRVQGIEASRHATQQIAVVVERQHQSLENFAKSSIKGQNHTLSCPVESTSNTLQQTDDIKNLSTTALVSLVQRLQTTQSSLRHRVNNDQIVRPLLTMSADDRQETFRAASVMSTGLKCIQRSADSDATESSSAGESDEEDTIYTPHTAADAPKGSIQSRACWRWRKHRSKTISKWTWLQAQVSDLEYRIRQHGELHRQLRSSKPQIENLYDQSIVTEESSQRAARCQPLLGSSFRRHKLIHSVQAPLLGQKARREVIVKCDCNKTLRQCAICAGHHNYAASRDMHLRSTNERIAQLDYSYHAVLSFGRDIKPGLLLEDQINSVGSRKRINDLGVSSTMLKREKIDKKYKKPEKMAKHKATDQKKKYKKRRHLDLEEYDPTLDGDKPKKKNHKKLAGKRQRTKSLPYLHEFYDNSEIEESPLAQSAPSTDLRDAKTPLSAFNLHKQRRENAYDIDNIVIPYSMAAATRVERLQYKEIDTPKWRELTLNGLIVSDTEMDESSIQTPVDIGLSKEPEVHPNLINHEQEHPSVEIPTIARETPLVKLTDVAQPVHRTASSESTFSLHDDEDVSEEAFIARHTRCEITEKKRYLNFITTGSARRTRVLSNAASLKNGDISGTATPDPWSPDGSFSGELRSPVIALSQNHELIQEELDCHRRRSSSFTVGKIKREMLADDEVSQIAPWTTRSFPLSDIDEKSLDPLYQPPPSLTPEWTVINTEDDENNERVAIRLKLAKH